MKIGEEDGKNVVYDDNGNLIISHDEKILLEKDNVFCEIRKRGKLGFLDRKTVFLWGKGKLYKTSKRIVFIRDPLVSTGYFQYTGGFPILVSSIILKKDSKKIERNIKQYFQFQLNEILDWKRSLFNKFKIFVKDKHTNEKYVIHMNMEIGYKLGLGRMKSAMKMIND